MYISESRAYNRQIMGMNGQELKRVPNKSNIVPTNFPLTVQNAKDLTKPEVESLLNHYSISFPNAALVTEKRSLLLKHIGVEL